MPACFVPNGGTVPGVRIELKLEPGGPYNNGVLTPTPDDVLHRGGHQRNHHESNGAAIKPGR